MNGHPRTRRKCPYMTGSLSSEGSVGWWRRPNIIHRARLPTIITTSYIHTESLNICIVIIMYAIVIKPKLMQHNSWGIAQSANTCIKRQFIFWRFTYGKYWYLISTRSPEFHSPQMAALSSSNRLVRAICVLLHQLTSKRPALYTMCFVETAQHLYSLNQTRTKNRFLLRHRGLKNRIRDFYDVMS